DAAEAAGLDPGEYEVQVVVADDIGRAIVEATSQYDTVCVGLSGRTEGSRIPFGTVTERVVHDVPSNVALIRGS
ncbi:universal stress protein, partial [Haloferax profundi]|uniref:universal stress protein n=1 Tax=Haloferax profundi TaxID=1544718 RepID=UPI000ACCFB69